MDCLKGFACLAVILIHYNFPGEFGVWVRTAGKFAVPYFFFVSGFFMAGSDGILYRRKTAAKVWHVLRLIIGTGLFYAIFFCVWNPLMNSDFSFLQYREEHLTWASLIKFFVSNNMIAYDHLWFLFALLYCYLVFLPFDNKRCSKRLIVPAGILMVCFLIFSEWNKALGIQSSFLIPGSEERIYLSSVFLFRALPFILLGIGLRQYEESLRERLKNVKLWVYFLFGCFGTVVAIVERILFQESQFYAGSYIVLIAMCILSIAQPSRGVRRLEHIGRDLSMYVYVLHIAVAKVYDLVAGKFQLWDHSLYDYTRAVLIIAVTLVLAELLYDLQKVREKK